MSVIESGPGPLPATGAPLVDGPDVDAIAPHGTETVVRLRGELDLQTNAEVATALLDLCHRGARRIVVDMSEVTFADASAARVLTTTHDRLRREHGGGLRIVSPSPRVARLLRLTRLEGLLEGASGLGGIGATGPLQRRVDPPATAVGAPAGAASWTAQPTTVQTAQSWSVSLPTGPSASEPRTRPAAAAGTGEVEGTVAAEAG